MLFLSACADIAQVADDKATKLGYGLNRAKFINNSSTIHQQKGG